MGGLGQKRTVKGQKGKKFWGGAQSNLGGRNALGREENKSSRFSRKGPCLNIGLSIHLSPEYLKELKCKSGKLNHGHSVNRGGLQNRQSCSFFLLNSHGGKPRLYAQVLFEVD